MSAGSRIPRKRETNTPGKGDPKRASTPAGVPAAGVAPSSCHGGCDPYQGREHRSQFTGGVVAPLLNPRLIAKIPPGYVYKDQGAALG